MSEQRCIVTRVRETKASPQTVFALLSDSSTYPKWGPVSGYEMERPGFTAPHGVGEIRVLSNLGIFRVREEIVELVPNRLMAYTLLSGLPMRDYRGETTLEALANGGTRFTWKSSFLAVNGNGWFMKPFMAWVLATMTAALAKGAEAAERATAPAQARS